jgi:hypothetical protein
VGARRLALGLVAAAALLTPGIAGADSATHHGTFSLAAGSKSAPIFFNYTSVGVSVVATICTEHGSPPLLQSVGASFSPTAPCETVLIYVTKLSGVTLKGTQTHSDGTYQITAPLVPGP